MAPPTPLQTFLNARAFIKSGRALGIGGLFGVALQSTVEESRSLAFSIFGGWGWKKRFANGIFGVNDAIMDRV
jgi:hypothetical protein